MKTITIVRNVEGQGVQVAARCGDGWVCANEVADRQADTLQEAIDLAYPDGDLRVVHSSGNEAAQRVGDAWTGGAWWEAEHKPAGFTKHDQGKPRTDLLPPKALLAMARVLAYGAQKYDDENWRQGGKASIPRYVAACLRHVLAHMSGELVDEETGESHLAHAMTCLGFVIELELETEGPNGTV